MWEGALTRQTEKLGGTTLVNRYVWSSNTEREKLKHLDKNLY